MARITLKNINKIYPPDVKAVDNVNLEIKDREFMVLVGPSGCGKSTTLRMISGLEEITDGELYIGETLVNHLPPKERDIAMVFQNYALYPHMTVFRNMSFGLELRKTPKDEIRKRVGEAARILDIEHLLDRKPKALSGGQRQRVALGRALVRDPKVFLLDEPLSNLDAKLRASTRTEIIKLHQKLGTTFVYVTHDQTEAMTMGDRITVMKDGVIQQVDTPQVLYEHPCNLFVAGFIGSPQMNFLDAAADCDSQGWYIVLKEQKLYLPQGKYDSRLDRYKGRPITLGIRPEDIYDAPLQSDCCAALPGAFVEISELMGNEVYLYLNYNGNRMTARVPSGTQTRNGQTINVIFDMKNVHLFDPETEETVLN